MDAITGLVVAGQPVVTLTEATIQFLIAAAALAWTVVQEIRHRRLKKVAAELMKELSSAEQEKLKKAGILK